MRGTRFAALSLVIALLLAACGGSGGGDAGIVAFFGDVGDLTEGGRVQLNDVKVGSVRDIELVVEEGRMLARVRMSIDPSLRIPANDLSAIVRQTSLLGEQFVELVPGASDAPFVGEKPIVIPVESTDRRVDVETFLSELSGFVGGGGLEDLNRFTHAQAVILEDRGRRFGRAIGELERFTGVLAARRGDLATAIDALADAGQTLASNRDVLGSFIESFADANELLAEESDGLVRLLRAFRRFGAVNARFLAEHESAIGRQFRSLRPILKGLAGAQGELRADIGALRLFFELFPRSLGGGPGGGGSGDYVQVDAVLCEALSACNTSGEKGDVPGEGS
ncbi:MAG: MCE family protein [Actinomycetota bacterium]